MKIHWKVHLMSTRPKKYGFFFSCSMIFFTVIFTMLFGGLAGGFGTSETGIDWAAFLGAIPTGLGIGFIITIFGLLYFICQEEG